MTSLSAGRWVATALVVVLFGAALAGTGVGAALGSTSNAAGSTAGAAGSTPNAAASTAGAAASTVGAVGPAPGTAPTTGASVASALADPPATSRATVTDRGGRASVTGTASAVANGGATLAMTQELRLTPEKSGSVAVTVRYEVPDSLTTLKTELPDRASVTGARGFARNGTVYEWDEETASASITYALRVNETRELTGPEGAGGQYLFVDTGDWALFKRPPVTTTWGWRGQAPVELTRSVETAGPGAVGDWMVYMGESESYERRAHGQQFRLVVPEQSSLAESPAAVLDSLATASDQLRVGDRDAEVVVFAAPTTAVEWGVRGLQFGDSDMYVRDVETLDTVENTWLHEYVHTRQDYDATDAAQWTVEAMATYYGAFLAIEQGLAPLGDLGPFLGRGELSPQSAAVLSIPTTWANAANYWKGSLVAGDLDRRIRVATDSEHSLQRVFSRLNAHPGTVGTETLFAAVGDVAGPTVRDAFEEFATTRRAPEMWSRATHEAVFATTPGRVSTGYANDSANVSVSGPYRNATLAPVRADGPNSDGPTYHAYVGETLSVTGSVTNAGEVATEYDLRFVVDEAVVATESGPIRPGETVIHTFERTFTESGDHVIAVGSDAISVDVFEPADATVRNLTANRTRLGAAGAVELTASLNNSAAVPARGTLNLTRDDVTVLNRTVTLSANAERSVVTTVTLPGDGEYTFRADDAEVVVRVGQSTNGGDRTSDGAGQNGGGGTDSEASGPGVGPVGAFLAILLGAALLARRRT